jgi:23S rRNA pseudouridine1911/1915/1917 synthase
LTPGRQAGPQLRRLEVPPELAGERVDRAVAGLLGLSRAEVATLVEQAAVRVGGKPVGARSRRVAAGERIEVEAPAPGGRAWLAPDPSVVVPVVHLDDHVIVVDKPAGLVVHPGAGRSTGTLAAGLLFRFPELQRVGDPARPGIVHRLDRLTSGLLVVARTEVAYRSLVAQLSGRSVERRYLALVRGVPEGEAGLVDAPIGRSARHPTRMAVAGRGREARTRYRVLCRFAFPLATSLLECTLETGRTHQLRVHLAAIGSPVLGDADYRGATSAIRLRRPFLHATRLAFDHPVSGHRLRFSSRLPDELLAVLAAFSSATAPSSA